VIDFRYFLVTIVAIFFALAVGIVLGSGPLENTINGAVVGTNTQLAQQKIALQNEIAALKAQQSGQDKFASSIEPAMVADLLAGDNVTLLVLPGADAGDVKASADVIEEAGGTVAGTITVTDAWTDPAQRDVLGQLTISLAPSNVDLPSDPYEAAAAVLSSALVDKSDHAASRLSPTDAGIVAGYQEAKFITLGGDNPNDIRRGSLAVIVAAPVDTGADVTALADQDATLLPFADSLRQNSQGVVAAGPPSSAQPGGYLSVVRDSTLSGEVSTDDLLPDAIGRVVLVLALQEQRNGGSGHYGTGPGADTVVPPVATPTP
jgi:hypothetical protein